MGLDVTGCCRLCLKDASGETTARVDLTQCQELVTLVQELYGLSVRRSERASKFICVPCYKNATIAKKQLDQHQTKAKLVLLNQAVLAAQVDDLEEEESEEDASFDSSRSGYRPPTSSPVDVLMKLKDCMQSKRFQELLDNRYELSYLLISGPVYDKTSNSFVEQWHPIQLYCNKCKAQFDSRTDFDDHTISCKYKCMFCKRHYTHEETLKLHSCPKRDLYRKSKKRKVKKPSEEPAAKRVKVAAPAPTPAVAQISSVEQTISVAKSTITSEKSLVPVTSLLPTSAAAPVIEGEANLDSELTNLLERWYGQTEDIDDLNLTVGTPPNDNGLYTNADLYGRVIDTAFREDAVPVRPAISVKPMSQLIETPAEELMPPVESDADVIPIIPPLEVIEIDDDDEIQSQPASAPALGVPLPPNTQEQSLSERDILSIVKHFRGIDENESYLVKAKINGAQKLICISKRKNEGSSQSSTTATIVNNNSALQSAVRMPSQHQKQFVIAPNTNQTPLVMHNTTTVVQQPLDRLSQVVKSIPDGNGAAPLSAIVSKPPLPTSSVPQLKIAHVQSLVQPHQIPQSSSSNPRLLNGRPIAQRGVAPNVSNNVAQKSPSATFTIKRAPPKPSATSVSPATAAAKPAPQRIIVGSNSIRFLSGGPPRLKPIAPKPATPGAATVTTTQQRIQIVQRKQTIVQSSVSRTSNASAVSSSQIDGTGNAMLRTRLLQQPQKMNPPRIYPGSSSAPTHQQQQQQQQQNGNKQNQQVKSAVEGVMSAFSGSSKQFKLNNTIIKRME